jgi:hypothetical protein
MTLALLVPVEDVRAGDVIRRPSGLEHVVVRVEGPYEDGTRVVVYASFDEATFENKARDRSGFNVGRVAARRGGERLAIEQSWRPLSAGEPVPLARRGAQAELDEALEALSA